MSKPTCQEERLDINEREWAPPCGNPATEQAYGRLMCEEHREFFEANEREALAETISDDVPLEDLRRIADAGGLKALLASHARLVKASEAVLPYLANHSIVPDHTFRKLTNARCEALPFLSTEPT